MSEDQQQTAPEPETTEGQPPAGEPPEPTPPSATLTQEQFDAALARRLTAERKKWQADADEAAKKATMSETERLKAEKEAAEKAVAEANGRTQQLIVRSEARVQALGAGAPLEAVDDVLKLVDLTTVEVGEDGSFDAKLVAAEIAAVKKRLPGLFGASAPGHTAGAADFTGQSDSKRTYSAKDVSAMLREDPKKWAEVKDDYMKALNEGRVRD